MVIVAEKVKSNSAMVAKAGNHDNDSIERNENDNNLYMNQSNIASSDPPSTSTTNATASNDNDKESVISAEKLSPSSSSLDKGINSALITTISQQLERYSFYPEIKSELTEILTSAPMFSLTDNDVQIQYRKKLGQGSFCAVYPIYIKNPTNETLNTELPGLFAIKKLKLDIVQFKKTNTRLFEEAYQDLFEEAMIIKELQHENIIHMFGMRQIEEDAKENFFVVVEQLSSTLDSRLAKWKNDMQGIFFTQEITSPIEVKKRLNNVVLGIAHGLQYLHSQRYIVYRDLKPANIGFDINGRVKILDFGLAVRLSSSSSSEDKNDGRKIKGKAGTIRYMAPEMKQGKFYDYSVDVYSFGILTWQIITAKLPFEKEIPLMDFFGDSNEQNGDILHGLRPDLSYIENTSVSSLLEHCWDEDPIKRWSFDRVVPELERIIEMMHKKEEENDAEKSSCSKRIELSSILSMGILQYVLLFIMTMVSRMTNMNKTFYSTVQGKADDIDNRTEEGKDGGTRFVEGKDGDEERGKHKMQVV